MHEGKYEYIKENANLQEQVYTRVATKAIWKIVKGELQKKKSVYDNRWEYSNVGLDC